MGVFDSSRGEAASRSVQAIVIAPAPAFDARGGGSGAKITKGPSIPSIGVSGYHGSLVVIPIISDDRLALAPLID